MKSRKHLADINLYTFLFSITVLGKSASHFLEMVMLISLVGMLIQARMWVGSITGWGGAGRVNICLFYIKIHKFISRNYVIWPTFLLMNVFIALKGSHFWFLFNFTAAGVVPCGGRKTSPRTSTIVQFIFYFGPLRSAIIFWEIRNKWLV